MSAAVSALSEGALHAMVMKKLQLIVASIALVTAVGAFGFAAGKPPVQKIKETDTAAPPGEKDRKPAEDQAVARLVKSLDDPDAEVRRKAIHELRMLARRVDRSGGKRIQRGDEFEPQVKGLLPVLIRAAEDKNDLNRFSATYALADTLDPAAVVALRARLKDDSEQVRLSAACLLTEFQDAAGLPEMKKALKRLRERPKITDAWDTERLLASFERITGKSFGEIPMNPSIISDSNAAAAATQRYRELLDTWAAWWEWTPARK
jgi:HEAT repeat protein